MLVTMLPLLLVCLHLPPLLCQAPFSPLPLSPLSLLGTIWSSVHRPRNLQVSCDWWTGRHVTRRHPQGLGGRLGGLFSPQQLRAKLTADQSFGDSNVSRKLNN